MKKIIKKGFSIYEINQNMKNGEKWIEEVAKKLQISIEVIDEEYSWLK